jgi:hypothetical protein
MGTPPPAGVVFLLGFLGTLAPEILRLYDLRYKITSLQFPKGYFAISIAYASLGGVVAIILPAVNYYAAFYTGVTLPATLSAIVKHRKLTRQTDTFANSKDQGVIKASRSTRLQRLKSLIRSHADGLFL